ncbi:sensor domain-containing diguanylate cyclase [Methylobacterium sp. Leaf118]|uniref:sensor domain-containing diguanylate cyclase n=1 Tax=Methylobacterium sp. Leaf118 TaxID=2876562 RepID=UPI0022B7A116|nr:sensor domain-containing diguanylate cyclase [Methylobacterium sp. Leaf118]
MPDPSPSLADRGATAGEDLRMQLRVQAKVIEAQRAELTRRATEFEPALRAAGIGLWACTLPDERLEWSDGVYDLFGLAPGSPTDRSRSLALYTADSRRALTTMRNRALGEGSGFSLDAEIVPPGRPSRWIRITATVERRDGVPVRLFGLKQDVSEEHHRLERMRRQSETDALTGLANRACFEARLRQPVGTLFLIDLDGFKAINDTFGHPVGDLCLREAARRIAQACGGADRKAGLVARIGGDEFAVVLDSALGTGAAASCAARIVEAMSRPFGHGGRCYRLGASVGVARSGAEASDPFTRADAALYAAKAAGRGTFRLSGAMARRLTDA